MLSCSDRRPPPTGERPRKQSRYARELDPAPLPPLPPPHDPPLPPPEPKGKKFYKKQRPPLSAAQRALSMEAALVDFRIARNTSIEVLRMLRFEGNLASVRAKHVFVTGRATGRAATRRSRRRDHCPTRSLRRFTSLSLSLANLHHRDLADISVLVHGYASRPHFARLAHSFWTVAAEGNLNGEMSLSSS